MEVAKISRSKQFNFYVHPINEKEVFEHLTSIPKMVRSAYLKSLILADSKKEKTSFIPNVLEPKKERVLSSFTDFEIDFDDI